MNELALEQQAATELEAAGYIVQRDVHSNTIGQRAVQVDLVAWAAAENGELGPELIVEVKRIPDSDVRNAAAMLPYYLPLIGAKRAYVFNGKWHLLSDDYRSLAMVDCPKPGQTAREARAPVKLVAELVWKSMDQMRGSGLRPEESWQVLLDALASGANASSRLDPQLAELAALKQNGPIVVEALLGALGSLSGCFHTPRELQQALVRLLAPQEGWLVADPFCGLGTLLAAVHREMTARGTSCKLVGGELNQQAATTAEKLLRLAQVDATVTIGDSLDQMPATGLNGIITNPPFGLKLPEPRPLTHGTTTRDGTLLVVDKVLAALTDEGRAVLVLPTGFLFAGGATEAFRKELAAHARVVSIIEIGAPVFQDTGVRVVVLVIEKAAPTDTLVARLEGDWQAQLSEDGEFMKAYRQHLGAVR